MNPAVLHRMVTERLEKGSAYELLAAIFDANGRDAAALLSEVQQVIGQLAEVASRATGPRRHALVAAVRLLEPQRQIPQSPEPATETDAALDVFHLAELVGLGHQTAAVAPYLVESEGAYLLRLSGRLMLAAAIVLETYSEPAPTAARNTTE